MVIFSTFSSEKKCCKAYLKILIQQLKRKKLSYPANAVKNCGLFRVKHKQGALLTLTNLLLPSERI